MGLPVKKSATILMVIGVVLLVFAFTVPPFAQGAAKSISTDLELTMVSESPQGFTRTEHLTTSPTQEDDEIAVRVEHTIEGPGDEVFSEGMIIDEVTLIGHSRFPVPEPSASMTGSRADHSGEAREGLQYFFPANTMRNSYHYYDITLGDTEPVDYLDRDGDVYTFYQHRRYQPIDEDTSYSVERTLDVEHRSGMIVDKHELITFHEPDGDREVEFSFTAATRANLTEHAGDITATLRTAKILDFTAKFLGLLLIGIGLFQTGIFRRTR